MSRVIARGFSSRTSPSEKLRDVRPPARPAPSSHASSCVRERGQVEEQVRRLAELRRRAVDDRARVDQVDGVELVAAVVALVAARLREAADRARALDVAVGQRAAGRGENAPSVVLLDEIALVVQRAEDVLRDPVVVARRRAREAVVRDPEIAQVVADERVVAVGELTRRHAARGRRRPSPACRARPSRSPSGRRCPCSRW